MLIEKMATISHVSNNFNFYQKVLQSTVGRKKVHESVNEYDQTPFRYLKTWKVQ